MPLGNSGERRQRPMKTGRATAESNFSTARDLQQLQQGQEEYENDEAHPDV
jgi:hypothetical protein